MLKPIGMKSLKTIWSHQKLDAHQKRWKGEKSCINFVQFLAIKKVSPFFLPQPQRQSQRPSMALPRMFVCPIPPVPNWLGSCTHTWLLCKVYPDESTCTGEHDHTYCMMFQSWFISVHQKSRSAIGYLGEAVFISKQHQADFIFLIFGCHRVSFLL